MATLTFYDYFSDSHNFAKLTAVVEGDDVDPKVFVVKDMVDPMDLNATVPYLMAVASRVDMTEYGDTPASPGEPYRVASMSMVFENANEIEDIKTALKLDVAINVETIQRQPLEVLQDIWIPAAAEVVATKLFYENSAWDTVSDDDAILTTKTALLPGGRGEFANVSSYIDGINGIMVDIAHPTAVPTVADFEFKVGNDDTPSAWAAAPAPTSVTVRPGEGYKGSDRVVIVWADGVIVNTWLEVTVLAAGLSMAEDYKFYFGNLPGETGNPENPLEVTTDDVNLANANVTPPGGASLTNPYDFNRDKIVASADLIIGVSNGGASLNPIEPPA